MSCYNPNLMKCALDKETGSMVYSFQGPAKWSNPSSFGSYYDLSSDGEFSFIVPCGHCLGCRMDYVRDWTHRLIYELEDNDNKGIFVTLTYNDAHLPMSIDGPTLCKRDCQLFFKRLRKHFRGRKIRFYLCGEYGPKTHRPHYHAILFGLTLDDFPDIKMFGMNELHQPYFSSDLLAKLWKNGFVQLSSVSYSTCSYVARYVTKKLRPMEFREDSAERVPEFTLSSRRPGIGFNSSKDVVFSGNDYSYFTMSDGCKTVSVPRSFYRNIKRHISDLSEDEQEYFLKRCYDRSKDSNDRLISNCVFFGLPFKDYLEKNCSRLVSNLRLLPERR